MSCSTCDCTKIVDFLGSRIDVIDESISEIQKITDTHKKGNKLSGEIYTNGHINRPV